MSDGITPIQMRQQLDGLKKWLEARLDAITARLTALEEKNSRVVKKD